MREAFCKRFAALWLPDSVTATMLLAAGRSLRNVLLPAARQLGLRAFAGAAAGGHDHHDEHDEHHEEGYKETPTVFDSLITLNVVDLNGKRHNIRALVGQTLSQALVDAGFPRVRTLPVKPLFCCRISSTPSSYSQTYFFPNMGFYTQHIVSSEGFVAPRLH